MADSPIYYYTEPHQPPNNKSSFIKGWDTRLIYHYYGINPSKFIEGGYNPLNYNFEQWTAPNDPLTNNLIAWIYKSNMTGANKGLGPIVKGNLTKNPNTWNEFNGGIPIWYFKTGKVFRLKARFFISATSGDIRYLNINAGISLLNSALDPNPLAKPPAVGELVKNVTQIAWANGDKTKWHKFCGGEIDSSVRIPVDLELLFRPMKYVLNDTGLEKKELSYLIGFKASGHYEYCKLDGPFNNNQIFRVPIFEDEQPDGGGDYKELLSEPGKVYELSGYMTEMSKKVVIDGNAILDFSLDFTDSTVDNCFIDYITIEELS